VNDYLGEVKTLLDNSRNQTDLENKMIKDKLFVLSHDPTKTYVPPTAKETVPFLNFSDLENTMIQLKNASEEFQKIYSNGLQLPVEKQNELNMLLYKAERSLIDPDGLPRRPWYKHEIYAPGYYTGYGVKTLPGIREAIEQRNWKEAQDNIEIVSKVLQAYNTQVQDAIDLVKKNAEKKSF
jgi:N-acetylated-alpha-linked acidic dipeptidase